MQRPVAGKRIATALATASLAAALGAAGAAPVQAADQSTTPEPVSFVIDFTTTSIPQVPSLGGGFAGNGPVTDALGRRIGKVYDTCTFNAIEGLTSASALCKAVVVFNDGDQLSLSGQAKIELNPLKYPYEFKAMVEGGTGDYNGARGEATVTAERPGVYKVDVQFK
ncbi:hypothetical protein FE633_03835 [Streptomyces montanus]|uniref:Dirigent protein n=1 Tax=Streptomyces montanus TaxID=2580423 RepID=A0A5R9G822_9ACTN|nr:hypothetical protein [Streptomyces montanus]TLS47625.1 hypothetical protein FE633_03835 [Streptomyces montanus]